LVPPRARDSFGAMRLFGTALLLAALAAPAACSGRQPQYAASQCPTITWGGWDGTPDCAGIAAALILSEHRGCGTDADCALVGQTQCSAHAVNNGAAVRYASYPPPCGHPLAGMCAPVRWRAACQQGCCVPVGDRAY
jgi:hypothetical protein